MKDLYFTSKGRFSDEIMQEIIYQEELKKEKRRVQYDRMRETRSESPVSKRPAFSKNTKIEEK